MAFRNRVTRLSQLIADTVTGGTLIGTLLTAATGQRIEVTKVGGVSTINFYDDTGTFQGYIGQSGTDLMIVFGSRMIRMGAGSGGIVISDTAPAGFVSLSGSLVQVNGDHKARDFVKTGSISTGVMVAGTDKTISVAFTNAFPDAAYEVFLTIRDGTIGAQGKQAVYTNRLSTGFDIVTQRSVGTGAFTISWTAIRTTD